MRYLLLIATFTFVGACGPLTAPSPEPTDSSATAAPASPTPTGTEAPTPVAGSLEACEFPEPGRHARGVIEIALPNPVSDLEYFRLNNLRFSTAQGVDFIADRSLGQYLFGELSELELHIIAACPGPIGNVAPGAIDNVRVYKSELNTFVRVPESWQISRFEGTGGGSFELDPLPEDLVDGFVPADAFMLGPVRERGATERVWTGLGDNFYGTPTVYLTLDQDYQALFEHYVSFAGDNGAYIQDMILEDDFFAIYVQEHPDLDLAIFESPMVLAGSYSVIGHFRPTDSNPIPGAEGLGDQTIVAISPTINSKTAPDDWAERLDFISDEMMPASTLFARRAFGDQEGERIWRIWAKGDAAEITESYRSALEGAGVAVAVEHGDADSGRIRAETSDGQALIIDITRRGRLSQIEIIDIGH